MPVTSTNAITAQQYEITATFNATPLVLKYVTSIGQVGNTGVFEDATTLDNSGQRFYIAGLTDVAENTLTFQEQNPPDADHQTFQTWAADKETVTLEIKNTRTGKTGTAQVSLAGYVGFDDPSAGDIETWSVNYRAAGDWVWSYAP